VGAMAVFGKPVGRRRPLLALPPAWEERAGAEERFQRAESLRHRYVAATRAGAALVVTRGPGKVARSPWKPLLPFLDGAREIPDPQVSTGPRETPVPLEAGVFEKAVVEIRRRLETSRTPSYAVSAAKAYALSTPPGTPPKAEARRESPAAVGEGEHGVEWGLVVHQLLHLAASRPGADLMRHARTAPAVDLVHRVMASALWRRASGSRRLLSEVPFEIVREGSGGRPLLLRGAIDLVFEEPDGWVLVDYKTDLPGRRPGTVAARYAPQLRLYADAWRTCTGEEVKKALIFFVSGGLSVDVPLREG
jgi:ATP-dependent helicase/nuclease subunit A